MVHYSHNFAKDATIGKARSDSVRVSFKNTRETAMALKGMRVDKALQYLDDVIDKKRIIPFRRFIHGVGHHSQCKNEKWMVGRWPQKSCKQMIRILTNAAANAKSLHDLEETKLFVSHVCVQRAQGRRRRTYRAHGRVTKFASQPCHIELVVAPRRTGVPKASTEVAQ
eukprot:gnl/Dysnectes_brevis/172_a199_7427.p1 GENE.gnl/Dysnectes_brevis/172_a199_7427~~gnl/Dysnectes_brevis/172_a199_7427.p1  ORF type:complete len:168 (+),score=45.96 gnl/Dysnectes_brevis/172_a199_7427:48-551(+)